MALARHLSDDQLQPVFNQACKNLDFNTVAELLRIGGDPFWTNSKGFTCIMMAALSPIDARYKLRVLQSEWVSVAGSHGLTKQTNDSNDPILANPLPKMSVGKYFVHQLVPLGNVSSPKFLLN